MTSKLIACCTNDDTWVKYYCFTTMCANDDGNRNFCSKCKIMQKNSHKFAAHPPQARLLRELLELGESLIGSSNEYTRSEIVKIARFGRKYRTYSMVFSRDICNSEMRVLHSKCVSYACAKAGINMENEEIVKRCRDKFWVFVGVTDATIGRNICAAIDSSAFAGSSLWFIN